MNYNEVIQTAARGDEVAPQGAERPAFDAKDFARRVYRGEIFTSDQIAPDDMHLTRSIFMPILFMGEQDRQQMIDANVTLLYAYMRDACPQAVNGYPIFMSVDTLTCTEHEAFRKEIKAIIELLGE